MTEKSKKKKYILDSDAGSLTFLEDEKLNANIKKLHELDSDSDSDSEEIKLNYEPSPFGEKRIQRISTKATPNKIPLPQGENFAHGILCGSSGSGKTSMLLDLVPKYVNLSGIIVISLIDGISVYKLIKKYCKENKIRYEFSNEVNDAYDKLKDMIDTKPKNTQTLVLADDFMTGKAMNSSSSTPEGKFLLHIFSKVRNYYCSCILIQQSYTSVPTQVRANCNFLCYYKIKSKTGIDAFVRDMANLTGHDIDVCKKIIYDIKEVHSYMLCTQNEIYVYKPSQYKEGEILKPIEFNCEEDHHENDKFTLNFGEILNYISYNQDHETINMFKTYIDMLSITKKIPKQKLVKEINEEFDVNLY